ncbi:MAG: calcium-binding protein, partial [Allosphingosinicella sp.]
DDTYFIDDAGDVIVENGGEGSDFAYTNVSYTLAAGQSVEYLSVIGFATTFAIDLTGNEITNSLYGNAGTNVLDGGGGDDTMVGFAGDDTYFIDDAGDVIVENGGEGSDFAYTNVSYTLAAGQSVEYLAVIDFGTTTAIDLTGNEFTNTLYGNAGDNVLDGKGGGDTLLGQGGADTFAFTTALGGGNVDAVVDFAVGVDRIALDDAVFTGLAPGALPAGAFRSGAAAQDADDRIIYDPATGALFFDADGNGGGAAIQFATLATGLTPTAADFVVV